MPYQPEDLAEGENTILIWLAEATGSPAAEVASWAGLQYPVRLKADGRARLYYLYALIAEADARVLDSPLPEWLRAPLAPDLSEASRRWEAQRLREQHSAEKYRSRPCEYGPEDNPYDALALALDGRTPIEFLIAGEWATVFHVIVAFPERFPLLKGWWGGKWRHEEYILPYTDNSDERPLAHYRGIFDAPMWLGDEDERRISEELDDLYPESVSVDAWSDKQLQAEVEKIAGRPVGEIVSPDDARGKPRDGLDADHWLLSRYTYLRALQQRDVVVADYLAESHSFAVEPSEWLRGARVARRQTGVEMLRENRWTGLWQALESLPFRVLPRVTLRDDTWSLHDELFFSSYPEFCFLDAAGESLTKLQPQLLQRLLKDYPMLQRVLIEYGSFFLP